MQIDWLIGWRYFFLDENKEYFGLLIICVFTLFELCQKPQATTETNELDDSRSDFRVSITLSQIQYPKKHIKTGR